MEKLDYISIIQKLETRIKELEIENKEYKNQNEELKKLIDENSTKGCIYECKIIDDENKQWFYIGSTKDFERRVSEHLYLAKRKPNCNFYKKLKEIEFNENKYEFKPIEHFDKILKYDLLRKEKENYEFYKNQGKNMLNDHKLFIGGINLSYNEYKKHYRENNKIELKEQNKQYRETNKEKIKNVKKEYVEKNKERIKEQKQIKNICEICNGVYSHSHKSEHNKTKKHKKAMN